VYDTQGNTETITLPSPSSAVYFYAAPDQQGAYQMEATATGPSGATASSGVIVVPENPVGDPAPSGQYFGFYGTGGDQIQSITIDLVDPNVTYPDFAIGDFALAGDAVVDDDLTLSGMPTDFSVDATTPAGATVTYTPPTAVDEDDPGGTATVTCSPASGSTFAIGATTVTCAAIDADDSNDAVTGSFTVTVKSAAEQLSALAIAVEGLRHGHGLARKVARAEEALAMGETRRACRILGSFRWDVWAEAHRGTSAGLALTLIADARRIQTAMGCGGR
jgi:hypothetical protein